MTDQHKEKLRKAIQLADNASNILDDLFEKHKAHCIKHNGAGLNPGITLEDLDEL